MKITGTHFNYFMICHRKLWLFANGIQMEHTSDLVYAGKLIHETSYPDRAGKYTEIEIDGIKIDFYDPKEKVVHEIKKSGKREEAHEWQLKYYLYILEKKGIEGVTGRLEYPRIRETKAVSLNETDRKKIGAFLAEIHRIIELPDAPGRLPRSKCRNCAYYDFCWSGESEEN